jgi:hypothetical protein
MTDEIQKNLYIEHLGNELDDVLRWIHSSCTCPPKVPLWILHIAEYLLLPRSDDAIEKDTDQQRYLSSLIRHLPLPTVLCDIVECYFMLPSGTVLVREWFLNEPPYRDIARVARADVRQWYEIIGQDFSDSSDTVSGSMCRQSYVLRLRECQEMSILNFSCWIQHYLATSHPPTHAMDSLVEVFGEEIRTATFFPHNCFAEPPPKFAGNFESFVPLDDLHMLLARGNHHPPHDEFGLEGSNATMCVALFKKDYVYLMRCPEENQYGAKMFNPFFFVDT